MSDTVLFMILISSSSQELFDQWHKSLLTSCEIKISFYFKLRHIVKIRWSRTYDETDL